jgi:phosphoserine phosphatase
MASELSRTRVVIVRHAQSTFNAENRYQGRENSAGLTAKGREDAAALGRRLGSEPIDVVITSPLRRARQTAELVAATLCETGQRLPRLIDDANLMELDLPEWQGLSMEAVQRDFPEAYRLWHKKPEALTMAREGAGSFRPVSELFAQTKAFWRECLAGYRGQTILAVTHSGTARALVSTALGIGPPHFHGLEQSNGAISVVEFPIHSSHGVVERFNDTGYLGRVLPKLKTGKSGVRLVMRAGFESAVPRMRVDVEFEDSTPESLVDSLRRARRESTREGALNALWRGPATSAEAFVGWLLEIPTGRRWWKHARDAVVHFPDGSRGPVVQALNTL